ncbi:MAG: putative lipoprotein [Herminiimonas sp.]|jgi:hypothetical protein|nr:putative lipoprotein [Herminiimonas sp.]
MKSSLLLQRISARLGLTALSLAALAGCAPLTPNLDAQFGDSVNLLKAQQVIDVRASADTRVVRLDAAAAREAIVLYHQSFRAPTPPPGVITIGVAGGQ